MRTVVLSEILPKNYHPVFLPVTRTLTRTRFFKLTRLVYVSVHHFEKNSVYFTFPYTILKSYPYPVITLYVFGYGNCTEYGFRTRTSGYDPIPIPEQDYFRPFLWPLPRLSRLTVDIILYPLPPTPLKTGQAPRGREPPKIKQVARSRARHSFKKITIDR